eukprot:4719589-Pleurochrysis_carterae.AAC.7
MCNCVRSIPLNVGSVTSHAALRPAPKDAAGQKLIHGCTRAEARAGTQNVYVRAGSCARAEAQANAGTNVLPDIRGGILSAQKPAKRTSKVEERAGSRRRSPRDTNDRDKDWQQRTLAHARKHAGQISFPGAGRTANCYQILLGTSILWCLLKLE